MIFMSELSNLFRKGAQIYKMISDVVSVELAIDEKFEIKKHRIVREGKTNKNTKRISIVTGIHGDELEGQYVCFELSRRILSDLDKLSGIIDIYPSLNPLGMDTVTRGIPGFDLDMNRIFPGSQSGSMAEYAASKIINDIAGSAVCVDIHASNIFLTEIPQVRISEQMAEALVPKAININVDFIWIHGAATVLQSTLAHSLNSMGTPTLVVEMGVGLRITKEYGNQLVEGILNLMKSEGIWSGETGEIREPIISSNSNEVSFINAPSSGIFLPYVKHWTDVRAGEHIGDIVDPLSGMILDELKSPVDGRLFTIREYPVVSSGSLIARILERQDLGA